MSEVKRDRYVVYVWGSIEPRIENEVPYSSDEERLEAARSRYRTDGGCGEHDLFWLDVVHQADGTVRPEIGSFESLEDDEGDSDPEE